MESRFEHFAESIVRAGDNLLGKGGGSTAVNTMCADFLEFCRANKLSYRVKLHTSQVMCHPKNRGGLMLNPYNAHKNLDTVHKVGANMKELHAAVCVEVSGRPDVKASEIAANRNLIDASDGLLAPLSGEERVLSVGCGHMAGGCRAANNCCRTHVHDNSHSG